MDPLVIPFVVFNVQLLTVMSNAIIHTIAHFIHNGHILIQAESIKKNHSGFFGGI